MEMHQLRYALAVSRFRNFSRAAGQCRVAQPSLSQQIQKLEDELGERIFERTPREAKLTPFGESFIPRAARILEEAEAARRDAAEMKGLVRGTLAIGVLPTIAPYLIPKALSAFTSKYPGVQITILEDTTARLIAKLVDFEADLAILSTPLPESLTSVHILDDELLLALPPDHPLTRQTEVKPAQIRKERFIVMKEGNCLGDQMLGFCEKRGIRPQISFQSAQLETVQALVRGGLGLSLVPAMARKRTKDAPEYRPFTHPKPFRPIVAAHAANRTPSRAVREFLKILTGEADQEN